MKKNVKWLFLLMPLALAGCEPAATRTVDAGETPAAQRPAASVFQCPMHPTYSSSDADASCPICGMSLVAAKTDVLAVESDASVSVSAAMIQSMGVRAQTAEVVELGQSLRAFGSVEADERRENVTVSRLEGWIEALKINAEGDTVKPGTELYRIYSPDMIAAQKDYLNSLKIGNEKRILSVRRRLLSLGVQESVVQMLDKNANVIERIPVFAEASGVVVKLEVREGDYVKPGTPVMRLQSYQNVWVIASIPEQNLSRVKKGIHAALTFPSAPDATTTGTVDYVYPTIDVKTRTGKVRIEVKNELGNLRPGAYADIVFSSQGQQRLAIPTESVLRDSRGQHVIMALGNGRFSSRLIQTGMNNGVLTEVLDGLVAGERVVTSGQFLLDSEVNLREGLSKLSGSDAENEPPEDSNSHSGHNH